jgi:hypothetical protein
MGRQEIDADKLTFFLIKICARTYPRLQTIIEEFYNKSNDILYLEKCQVKKLSHALKTEVILRQGSNQGDISQRSIIPETASGMASRHSLENPIVTLNLTQSKHSPKALLPMLPYLDKSGIKTYNTNKSESQSKD